MSPKTLAAAVVAVAALCVPGIASADVVVDWNRAFVDAMYTAHTPPQLGTRMGAIVQTSVFDSVNGITRRYAQYQRPGLVIGAAPRGASAPAAAASAAYTVLVSLFPDQKPTFDAQLTASLAQISNGENEDGGNRAVKRGLDWGKSVANTVMAWRTGDGLTATLPDYDAGPTPADGVWRPQVAVPKIVNPVFRQFAKMIPWTMTSPWQFLPAPPPALNDPQYLADLIQVRTDGNSTFGAKADTARFWQGAAGGDTVATIWNRTADSLAAQGHRSITQNARLFALMNLALADSTIAVWNAKNEYNFWRPITAIQLVDPNWKPTIGTPNHQEYPSGHSGASSAAATVLASFFGAGTTFKVISDGLAAPANERTYDGFAKALAEVNLARVYGGIHFLSSCTTAQTMGRQLAEQALATQMLPLRGHDDDDDHGEHDD